jgi:hypothetical protein
MRLSSWHEDANGGIRYHRSRRVCDLPAQRSGRSRG